MTETDFWADAEVISIYSRAQAIEDGVLVDVSELAKEAGFKYPVAVTAAVWSECVRWSEDDATQDETGRLWDVLFVAMCAAKRSTGDRIEYTISVRQPDGTSHDVDLWAQCGPGDDPEPVITIMVQGED